MDDFIFVCFVVVMVVVMLLLFNAVSFHGMWPVLLDLLASLPAMPGLG